MVVVEVAMVIVMNEECMMLVDDDASCDDTSRNWQYWAVVEVVKATNGWHRYP